MQFGLALFEYIVAGTCSLLWIFPILIYFLGDGFFLSVKQYVDLDEINSLAFLPLIYILGISIDRVFSFIDKNWYSFNKSNSATHTSNYTSYDRTVKILLASENLGRAMEYYVSRERISRCVIINLIGGLLAFSLYGNWLAFFICLFFIPLSIYLYRDLNNLSNDFKNNSAKQIDLISNKNL